MRRSTIQPEDTRPKWALQCLLRRQSDITLFQQVAEKMEFPSNNEILRNLMNFYAADKSHGIRL